MSGALVELQAEHPRLLGDVHGCWELARGALEHGGLIDAAGAWVAPPGTALVQLGDLVDRGGGRIDPTAEALAATLADAPPGAAVPDPDSGEPVTLEARGGRALVPTGAAIAIPVGYAGFVQPRSGLALRHGVTCLNTPGLIDAGYRGELKVLLVNTDPRQDFHIERGDRIAQLVIQRVEHVLFQEVDELPASDRGDGSFGSTGVKSA